MKTVFLDRDGTIIIDKDYLSDPLKVELETGAGPALRRLMEAGYRLVGVTNQSGVGRGYFSLDAVKACNLRVDELLSTFGVKIEGWFICPHAPDEACNCRKPSTGLIDAALARFQVDVERSYVIGDKDSDVLLGEWAGMSGILVCTGSGRKFADWAHASGRLHFDSLDGASLHICGANATR